MDARPFAAMFAALFVFSFSVGAQTRVATGGGVQRVPQPSAPAYNPLSKSTTPFDCRRYQGEQYPPNWRAYCQSIENSYVQGEARRVGRPLPSASVIALPPLGSGEAKALGYACVGGTAMRRLANGWEQLSAPDGNWQRCVEGIRDDR